MPLVKVLEASSTGLSVCCHCFWKSILLPHWKMNYGDAEWSTLHNYVMCRYMLHSTQLLGLSSLISCFSSTMCIDIGFVKTHIYSLYKHRIVSLEIVSWKTKLQLSTFFVQWPLTHDHHGLHLAIERTCVSLYKDAWSMADEPSHLGRLDTYSHISSALW